MLHGLIRILLGAVLLFVCQIIGGILVPVRVPAPANILGWLLLSDLAIAAGVGIAAMRSAWRKWTLALVIFVVVEAIQLVNLLEGSIFLKIAMPWGALALESLVIYALASVALTLVFTWRSPSATPPLASGHTWAGRVWRFLVADALYPVLYFAFGLLILPLIRDFYATQTVPSAGRIVMLQFFVRGPVFIVVSLVLAHMVQQGERRWAWLTGICFTLLSGVAPLVLPNPYFPDTVRYAHLFEVTTENFILAWFTGYIWYYRSAVAKAAAAAG